MNEKEMCQILSDLIAASDQKVIVNGYVYSERRGTVRLELDARAAILELMARTHCRKVDYGTYDCYEETMQGVAVDGCLVGEINRLNSNGIKTIGCCCGHGKQQGYIQVSPECVDDMVGLGYEQLDVDGNGNGVWCFIPKTSLPKEAATP